MPNTLATPILEHLPAGGLRRLLNIADMADELLQNMQRLVSDDWQQADQRIAEIQVELAPLLAAHRRLYPARSPFDGDARAKAQPIDDDDSWPIIVFL